MVRTTMKCTVSNVSKAYISCASNRTPHVVDWGSNGLISFGACNAVAIYDPKKGGKIIKTLTGHKGRVNAVRWIREDNVTPELELVSVSADHCGIIWSLSDNIVSVLKGHEGSVTVVDAVHRSKLGVESALLVVTASVDSTIRVWERKNNADAVVCSHVVALSSGICLALRLAPLLSAPLLACALDDCNIHVYSIDDTEGLVPQQILKGHEDWVTALDFTVEDGGDLLLGSGSHDASVRLWRFRPSPIWDDGDGQPLLRVEECRIVLGHGAPVLAVSLESVLLGHEGRVYGICWHPPITDEKGRLSRPLRLLTTSLDKTAVLWSPSGEGEGGVWLEEARMGEVGGNSLGFYGGCFGPNGDHILAHGYHGGFHMWRQHKGEWRPVAVVGGHFGEVTDLAWEPHNGRYLLSVSSDQTTRLHAPWLPDSATDDSEASWHEIARPQVHGYDLVCLAMLPGYRFASGADEKVVRAFAAPQNFLENFKRLCFKNSEVESDIGTAFSDSAESLPAGAAVPVLGLSNKAVFQKDVKSDTQTGERHVKDLYDDNSYFTPQHLKEPPTEDNLLQNTLWPETVKLYGHGYEVFSLAASNDGKYLASGCKATNQEHAAILLWECASWHKVGQLVSHQLTVTQMQFSPDDRFLLSVSRDRRWSLFEKSDSGPEPYKLVGKTDKSNGIHSRIIWCCAWTNDSLHFATGSRDGKVVVWSKAEESIPPLGPFAANSDYLDLPKESITAVAFASRSKLTGDEYLAAVGSEAGDVRLYAWSQGPGLGSSWRYLYQISGYSSHHLAVKRLAFRPRSANYEDSRGLVQLATCGLDHTVIICDILLTLT